ncbi:hypothetical protein [Vibrio scophthalmi]|uniref:Uncharacterized protein n=1 Tax=Vibrio scophthalmi LMG 19158 TaxID=870967 RepID=F9RNW3_9VIBR|nr:hypothetical protein [Vibrio scophthalmi]EGU36639.1 hypothetical protein VIS19158_21932 [Vibrio scophthalmi LMG 19158]
MSFLKNIANALTGGLAETVLDTVKAYLPPDLSPEQQANIELALQNLELTKNKQAAEIALSAEQQITERIKDLEGTAADLKTIPILGPLMLFLRGCQRPIWGFLTIYMDVMWFSGQWTGLSETQESALLLINFLVLGFLFGERAIQNAAPVIERMMKRRHNVETKQSIP